MTEPSNMPPPAELIAQTVGRMSHEMFSAASSSPNPSLIFLCVDMDGGQMRVSSALSRNLFWQDYVNVAGYFLRKAIEELHKQSPGSPLIHQISEAILVLSAPPGVFSAPRMN